MESTGSLTRFLEAQQKDYATALEEIRKGKKRSHWMWYIFPQLKGLGFSSMAVHYGINDIREAKTFIDDLVVGYRLVHISQELLKLQHNYATAIFGSPDDLKLPSSMTLFSEVEGTDQVFEKVLVKYYDGVKDTRTLALLSNDL
ncbi:MAG: DUF1810 domain-containing protein [Sphingobacteriales bacterium]|nr:MAG: DUF1810 domain-containing protein [Sphingobacteriales bacterium]